MPAEAIAPAAAAAAEAPQHAVLLLHGLCGSPLELGAIPKTLQRLGYAVASPSIAGYSADQVEPGRAVDWAAWVDAVDAEVSALLQRYASVSLCGLSMGATLALAVAARRDDLTSVVCLSPVLRYDGWSTPWYGLAVRALYALGWRNWLHKEQPPYGLRNADMRRRVEQALRSEGVSEVGAAAIPARQLHAAQLLMRDVAAHLEQISARLLLIHAVDDEVAAPRNAELILRRVSSESRRVIWLGDCYHIITFDNEREIVTNEAVRFIDIAARGDVQGGRQRRYARRSALRDRRGR